MNWRRKLMICVQNSSDGKSYTETKRVVGSVIPRMDIRLNIGDVPKRVLLKLIKDLRGIANKSTEIKIYFSFWSHRDPLVSQSLLQIL
jgi:hypothetical protein